jgi:uracil-DNA glycosylase
VEEHEVAIAEADDLEGPDLGEADPDAPGRGRVEQDDDAGAAKLRRERRISRCRPFRYGLRALACRQPEDVGVVLDDGGDTGEHAGAGRGRVGRCSLEVADHESIQPRLQRLSACDGGLDGLTRADVAGSDGRGEPDRIEPCEFVRGVDRLVQRVTLPAFRHEVQTLSRFGVPETIARTRWMFGSKRRFVRRCECDTLWPNPGPLPHTSHTAATEDHSWRIRELRTAKE